MERDHEEELTQLRDEFEALRQEADVKLAVAFRKINDQADHIYSLEVALETMARQLHGYQSGPDWSDTDGDVSLDGEEE